MGLQISLSCLQSQSQLHVACCMQRRQQQQRQQQRICLATMPCRVVNYFFGS